MSETNELAAALAIAQGQFTNPPRNRTVKVALKGGGSYEFRYATLDAILDMIRVPLSMNGLALSHELSLASDGWVCITKLLHSSGNQISCPVPVLVGADANAQGWGSGITYSKRYGVCALLAIAADEDDDGNAACGNEAKLANDRRGKADAKPSFGAQKPAAPKTETPINWATANSQQRKGIILSRIADGLKSEGGIDAVLGVKERLGKVKPGDLTAADMAAAELAVSAGLVTGVVDRISVIRKIADPIVAMNALKELAGKPLPVNPTDAAKIAEALTTAEQDISAECSGQ